MSEKFYDKKNYILLFVILFFIYFVFLIINSFIRKDFVIVNDVNGIFVYRNNSWNYIKNYHKFISKKYDIFSGDEYIGKYYLGFSKGLYLYDKEKNNINSDYEVFAVTNKNKVNIISFGFDYEDVPSSFVDDYINFKGIITNSSNYVYSSFDYDLDKDGVLEKIVSVSNYTDLNSSNFFSAVYVIDDGTFYDIKFNTSDSISNLEIMVVNKVLDVFNDGKIEFIIDKFFYSQPMMHCEDLYQFDHKTSKRYTSCTY